MTEAAPKLYRTDYVPNRRAAHHAKFLSALAGFATIEADEATASAQMILANRILPDAGDDVCAVFINIVTEFVRDPQLLLDVMVPRHLDVLESYGWVATPDQPPEPAELAEGFSIFWMAGSTNDFLVHMERSFLPMMHGAFFLNSHQTMAMRAWLRIQAYHVDIDHLHLIKDIWALKWSEAEPAKDHGPAPARLVSATAH